MIDIHADSRKRHPRFPWCVNARALLSRIIIPTAFWVVILQWRRLLSNGKVFRTSIFRFSAARFLSKSRRKQCEQHFPLEWHFERNVTLSKSWRSPERTHQVRDFDNGFNTFDAYSVDTNLLVLSSAGRCT